MTGVSTLGQALEQIQRIKEQQSNFAELSLQVTSGKKTQSFSGLGNDVLTSQRTRADFKSLEGTINNIKNADRRMSQMISAVNKFKQQAENFLGLLVGLNQESPHQTGEVVTYDDPLTTTVVETTRVGMTGEDSDAAFTTLREAADRIFSFMIDLMNSKDGDRYIFGGAEALTPPITDSGTLDAALSSLITQWKGGTITNAGLIADLEDRIATGGNADALTDTIVGYSAALSAGNAGKVFVRTQDNAEIDYTTLANDQAFRDIFVALSYFKNDSLPPIADVYEPPNAYPGVPDALGAPGATLEEMKENFYAVYNRLTAVVNAAVDRIDQVSANLANSQARITLIKQAQEDDQNILLTSISDVEDVDLNEVAIKIQALQVQLQASYSVTATLQQYSLVNFLFNQ